MAQVFNFVAGSKGDRSVGIWPFEEHITVVYHDRLEKEDMEEEKKNLRGFFAEQADGYCLPFGTWLTDLLEEASAGGPEA